MVVAVLHDIGMFAGQTGAPAGPMSVYLRTNVPCTRMTPRTNRQWAWVCLEQPTLPDGLGVEGGACGAVYLARAEVSPAGKCLPGANALGYHTWVCLARSDDNCTRTSRNVCVECGSDKGVNSHNIIDPFNDARPRNLQLASESLVQHTFGTSKIAVLRAAYIQKTIKVCVHLAALAEQRRHTWTNMQTRIAVLRSQALSTGLGGTSDSTKKALVDEIALLRKDMTVMARTHGVQMSVCIDEPLLHMAGTIARSFFDANPKKRSHHSALAICLVVLSHSSLDISIQDMLDMIGTDMLAQYFAVDKRGALPVHLTKPSVVPSAFLLAHKTHTATPPPPKRKKTYTTADEWRCDLIDKERKSLEVGGHVPARTARVVGVQTRNMVLRVCALHASNAALRDLLTVPEHQELTMYARRDGFTESTVATWVRNQLLVFVRFLETDHVSYFARGTGSDANKELDRTRRYRQKGTQLIQDVVCGNIPLKNGKSSGSTQSNLLHHSVLSNATTKGRPVTKNLRNELDKALAIKKATETQEWIRLLLRRTSSSASSSPPPPHYSVEQTSGAVKRLHDGQQQTDSLGSAPATGGPPRSALEVAFAANGLGLGLGCKENHRQPFPAERVSCGDKTVRGRARAPMSLVAGACAADPALDSLWTALAEKYTVRAMDGCEPLSPARSVCDVDTEIDEDEAMARQLQQAAAGMLGSLLNYTTESFQQYRYVRRKVTSPVLLVLRWLGLVFPCLSKVFETVEAAIHPGWKQKTERGALFIHLPLLAEKMAQYVLQHGASRRAFGALFLYELTDTQTTAAVIGPSWQFSQKSYPNSATVGTPETDRTPAAVYTASPTRRMRESARNRYARNVAVRAIQSAPEVDTLRFSSHEQAHKREIGNATKPATCSASYKGTSPYAQWGERSRSLSPTSGACDGTIARTRSRIHTRCGGNTTTTEVLTGQRAWNLFPASARAYILEQDTKATPKRDRETPAGVSKPDKQRRLK